MKIVYAGSPDISARVLTDLNSLINSGNAGFSTDQFEICAVLTNPPSAKGRHHDLIPTPVGEAAEILGIPVFAPEHLDAEARKFIESLNPDILVCFAYGKIFGPKFMAMFPKGGINLHPSLLPKYRGCAPAQAAILNMEKESGISIQRIAQEMDCGDILFQEKLLLDKDETAETFLNKAASRGASMLMGVLRKIAVGKETAVPQDSSKATYCTMLKKEDGNLCWNSKTDALYAKIRAFSPWPGAFTYADGKMLKILEASPVSVEADAFVVPGTFFAADKKNGLLVKTGDGVLSVKTLQWQSKKAMNWSDFLNGSRNFIGTKCSEVCQTEQA